MQGAQTGTKAATLEQKRVGKLGGETYLKFLRLTRRRGGKERKGAAGTGGNFCGKGIRMKPSHTLKERKSTGGGGGGGGEVPGEGGRILYPGRKEWEEAKTPFGIEVNQGGRMGYNPGDRRARLQVQFRKKQGQIKFSRKETKKRAGGARPKEKSPRGGKGGTEVLFGKSPPSPSKGENQTDCFLGGKGNKVDQGQQKKDVGSGPSTGWVKSLGSGDGGDFWGGL